MVAGADLVLCFYLEGQVQSWGQIPKATRDFLTDVFHVNPVIACNPTKAGG